jgi:hypothetical protein
VIRAPQKKRAPLILLTAIILCGAVIFSGYFIISEIDHDCCGEDCPVCLQIEIAHRALEAFVRACPAFLLAVVIVQVTTRPHSSIFFPATLITLKIKLSA